MDRRGIKKIPGISTVEVNGKVYEFLDIIQIQVG
jgi:hypothetical protein